MLAVADRHLWSHDLLFHPESLCIEALTLRPEDLIAHFSRKHTAENVTPETVKFWARWLHEEDHFRRTLGTSFGLLCSHIRSRLFRTLADAVSAALSAGCGLEFPVVARGRRPSSCFRGLFEMQAALDALQGSVDGDTLTDAHAFFRRMVRRHGGDLREFQPLPPFRDTPVSGQPLMVNGQLRVVTGTHLLEFFGIGEEENHCVGLLDDSSHILGLRRLLSYSYVPAAWFTLFGRETIPDPMDQPGAATRGGCAYRIFPTELFAAADLALWPPYSPCGIGLVDAPLRWADVQPGARFITALAVMRDRKVSFTPIPATPEDRSRRLEEVQELICREMNWPTPAALAGEWLAFFNDHSSRFEEEFHDCPRSHRSNATRSLLEMRLRNAGDLVFNMFDRSEWDVPNSVAFLCSNDGFDLGILPIGDPGDSDTLRDFELYSGFRLLAFDYSDYQRMVQLDSHSRREISKRVQQECGKLGIPPELVRAFLEADLAPA